MSVNCKKCHGKLEPGEGVHYYNVRYHRACLIERLSKEMSNEERVPNPETVQEEADIDQAAAEWIKDIAGCHVVIDGVLEFRVDAAVKIMITALTLMRVETKAHLQAKPRTGGIIPADRVPQMAPPHGTHHRSARLRRRASAPAVRRHRLSHARPEARRVHRRHEHRAPHR